MKVRTELTYNAENELCFNQIIFEKLRGSICDAKNTFTAFEIDTIYNDARCIFPDTKAEVILNILDSSTAQSIKIGDILSWGVPYKAVGEILIKEIIILSSKSFFGR